MHKSKSLESGAITEVKVWDPLLRLFHWTLADAFFINYALGDDWLKLHVWIGYLIIGLLVFRLIWGFVGPRHARFSDFLYSRHEILDYLRDLPTGRAGRYLGHNPAGGAMVILLLVMLALTVLTGWLTLVVAESQSGWFPWPIGEGDVEGGWLGEIHEFFANATFLLVLIHIAGVLVSSLLHGENLVRAMITGRKRLEPEKT